MHPKCGVCKDELEDWQGNIMVPEGDFSAGKISKVWVVCKECTKILDQKGVGQKWHQLWELHWLKENTIHHLGWMMADLVDEEPIFTWDKEAVKAVYLLAALAHPELSRGSIEQWSISGGQV